MLSNSERHKTPSRRSLADESGPKMNLVVKCSLWRSRHFQCSVAFGSGCGCWCELVEMFVHFLWQQLQLVLLKLEMPKKRCLVLKWNADSFITQELKMDFLADSKATAGFHLSNFVWIWGMQNILHCSITKQLTQPIECPVSLVMLGEPKVNLCELIQCHATPSLPYFMVRCRRLIFRSLKRYP